MPHKHPQKKQHCFKLIKAPDLIHGIFLSTFLLILESSPYANNYITVLKRRGEKINYFL